MALEGRNPEAQVITRWNRAFDALKAEPRRQLVASLLDAESDTVALPDAAQSPAVPTDPDALTLELHHQHLPKLTGAGYIEWDDDPL